MENRNTLKDDLRSIHLQWYADSDAEAAKRFIGTEEGQAWFSEAAGGLGFSTAEQVETEKAGLVTKNKELLSEKRGLQTKITAAEVSNTAFTRVKKILRDYEIPIDDEGEPDYDSIEQSLSRQRGGGDGGGDPSELDELKRLSKKSSRDLEEANRTIETLNTSNEKKQADIDGKSSTISNLLIDGVLTASLATAGYEELIIPHLVLSLREQSKAEVTQDEETGEYKAATDDGRSIPDWIKYWADTDEGKAFKIAAINSGGGGKGSGVRGGKQKPWHEMSMSERSELFRNNKELYTQLKNAAPPVER